MRKSQAMASSQPPPKASELTAAIVTIRPLPSSRSRLCPPEEISAPFSGSVCVNALMSAPAENTTGTVEQTTIAWTSPASLRRFQTVPRSSISCGEIAFMGGFASQAIATSPRVSTFTVSVCSPSSGWA